jgi:hypothetical protein
MYGAESWALWKVDQKCPESFEMWCCRRMEKIIWSDRVGNDVLRGVKEPRNFPHTITRRNVNRIGHILSRNCILNRVIEGKKVAIIIIIIKVT